jgi:hypothetical protein
VIAASIDVTPVQRKPTSATYWTRSVTKVDTAHETIRPPIRAKPRIAGIARTVTALIASLRSAWTTARPSPRLVRVLGPPMAPGT